MHQPAVISRAVVRSSYANAASALADRPPIGRVSRFFREATDAKRARGRAGTDADWPAGRRDFSD